jgi:hypothetical protein
MGDQWFIVFQTQEKSPGGPGLLEVDRVPCRGSRIAGAIPIE